jgi:hypothetical protein
MSSVHRSGAKIRIVSVQDGLFRAECEALGLFAEGSTMAEAESALFRLIDERIEQVGKLGIPQAVESERDTRLEPE